MELHIIWFILVGILFTGYAILDGFDLGAGTLHLFLKKDDHRRYLLNSIGPVWDGNEVWLVVGGGALFAAFPEAYATVFSGFYIPFMLLLCALIFRAVAIEFRSKEKWRWWRNLWDISFASGSTASAFLIGVTMGNIVRGIALDADHEYAGSFLDLIHPYSLLLGVTTVALFTMHGAIYLAMKNEGELLLLIKSWIPRLIFIFLFCYLTFNIYTLFECPEVVKTLKIRPVILVPLILSLLAFLNIFRMIRLERMFAAFLSSCSGIFLLMMTFGLTYFPHIVYSNPHPENSLTLLNAASSTPTLRNILVIALIGLPLVLAYTICIYYIFRGKTKLTKHSY